MHPLASGRSPASTHSPSRRTCGPSPPECATVTWGPPSALADALHRGDLDLALVPHVELVASSDYRAVPGLAIACAGAVDSILLFSLKSWSEISTVAVDAASRSSVELLRVLFHLECGRIPDIVIAPEDATAASLDRSKVDALLCIGDRALADQHSSVPRADLSERWHAVTGLPFVFALWAGRKGVAREAIDVVVEAARAGTTRRPEIARDFAEAHPEVIRRGAALEYLTETLHHTFGSAEAESVARFADLRREIGSSVPVGWRLQMFSANESGGVA